MPLCHETVKKETVLMYILAIFVPISEIARTSVLLWQP
jgi:hypothetical protein